MLPARILADKYGWTSARPGALAGLNLSVNMVKGVRYRNEVKDSHFVRFPHLKLKGVLVMLESLAFSADYLFHISVSLSHYIHTLQCIRFDSMFSGYITRDFEIRCTKNGTLQTTSK